MEKVNKFRLILAPLQLLNFRRDTALFILHYQMSIADFSFPPTPNPRAILARILLHCQTFLWDQGLLTLYNNILQLKLSPPADYFDNERTKDLWIL